MTELADPRAAISTAAEDRFVELFAQAFGVEKVQLLSPEHPVQEIYGATRFVDFAIRTPAQRVAFKIDGLVWHHPEAISIAKFEDDLLRQNSLIHDAWRVYRWTDRQLAEDGERVKEQLILFLGAVITTKWSSSYTNPVLHSRQETDGAGLLYEEFDFHADTTARDDHLVLMASLVATPIRQRSPAASSDDLSSTRWREFICSKRTVARPVGVSPWISDPRNAKCSLHWSDRGLKMGTTSPVAGSTLAKLVPFWKLHLAHASARFAGRSSCRCC